MRSNGFYILGNNSFYQFQFLFLETGILHHFDWEDCKFRPIAILYHMHMNWGMVISIEQKSITEEYEYCWH